MNHLAHFHLARSSDALLVGALLGDFVRGPLRGDFPADIEAGIALHRRIDSYTDRHPTVRETRKLFSAQTRRYSGIALDILFDRQLALSWHPSHLQQFATEVYRVLHAHRASLTPPAQVAAARMRRYRVLERTTDAAFAQRALSSIARRLSRPMPLGELLSESRRLQAQISHSYRVFWPQLEHFVASL